MIPNVVLKNSLLFDRSRSGQEKSNIFNENIYDIAMTYICHIYKYYGVNNTFIISHKNATFLEISQNHFDRFVGAVNKFKIDTDNLKKYKQTCIDIFKNNDFYYIPKFAKFYECDYDITEFTLVTISDLYIKYPFYLSWDK